jgi:hypothetical protein
MLIFAWNVLVGYKAVSEHRFSRLFSEATCRFCNQSLIVVTVSKVRRTAWPIAGCLVFEARGFPCGIPRMILWSNAIRSGWIGLIANNERPRPHQSLARGVREIRQTDRVGGALVRAESLHPTRESM